MTRRQSLTIAFSAGVLGLRRLDGVDFSTFSDAQKELLLKTGVVVGVEEIGHGVTKPLRAKLRLRDMDHSAKIQSVSKELPPFFPSDGSRPVPMWDHWRFNIAAYKIDRLLGLGMATVAVARPYRGKPAAFSWWVDDVQFEEAERVQKGIKPPNEEALERQRALSRVFDELILNIDRNLSNLLITKQWNLVLIDHSRCFTPYSGIRNPANLTRCTRGLLAMMKKLTAVSVKGAVGVHLTAGEIQALLARRDRIVAFFERKAKEQGEESAFFA